MQRCRSCSHQTTTHSPLRWIRLGEHGLGTLRVRVPKAPSRYAFDRCFSGGASGSGRCLVLAIQLASELLQRWTVRVDLIIGLLLVAVALWLPQGVMGLRANNVKFSSTLKQWRRT